MEITKLQLKRIHNCTSIQNQEEIEKWFPEAFKVELEVGKWYYHKKSTALVNYQGGSSGYGFNALDNWCSIPNFIIWTFETRSKDWRLATTGEWESALIEEAKKRGYKNGNYKCLIPLSVTKITNNNYSYAGDGLYIGEMKSGSNYNKIYVDGVWADIIKTFSKEEAEKLLGGKII
jgi:hypothetical protein